MARLRTDVVYDYCEEDVRMSVLLLPRLLQGSNRFHVSSTEHVLHWSNYSAKAITQIQARGMPIDTYLWHLVQEHKPEIIRALIRRFDPSYGSAFPIYDEDGGFSYERFEAWLIRSAVGTGRAWKVVASISTVTPSG